MMEEGREEGGGGTVSPGPDPTVLAPALGKRTALSSFLRHCLGHQTVSQNRVCTESLINGRETETDRGLNVALRGTDQTCSLLYFGGLQ